MMTNTDVRYAERTVRTVRGLEARTRAKWEKDGWEFVSQTVGTVRSEIRFRRVAPKPPWKVLGIVGGVLVVLAGVITIGAITEAKRGSEQAALPSPAATVPTPRPSSSPAPAAPTSAATESPVSEVTATPISVDELVSRLNSADMGGIRTGDRFLVTAELVSKEFWMTGVTGDFSVLLRTTVGSDLIVFVDEADAAGWSDGTRVEMILESTEVTIDGDTSGGWMRAVSSRILS